MIKKALGTFVLFFLLQLAGFLLVAAAYAQEPSVEFMQAVINQQSAIIAGHETYTAELERERDAALAMRDTALWKANQTAEWTLILLGALYPQYDRSAMPPPAATDPEGLRILHWLHNQMLPFRDL